MCTVWTQKRWVEETRRPSKNEGVNYTLVGEFENDQGQRAIVVSEKGSVNGTEPEDATGFYYTILSADGYDYTISTSLDNALKVLEKRGFTRNISEGADQPTTDSLVPA